MRHASLNTAGFAVGRVNVSASAADASSVRICDTKSQSTGTNSIFAVNGGRVGLNGGILPTVVSGAAAAAGVADAALGHNTSASRTGAESVLMFASRLTRSLALAARLLPAGALSPGCPRPRTVRTSHTSCNATSGMLASGQCPTCGASKTLGSERLVGGGAMILDGPRIGSRAVIGAGSVVTRNVPRRRVRGGKPLLRWTAIAESHDAQGEMVEPCL